MINTAIVGATGYTGAELIKLLERHPQASLEMLTSRSAVGQSVDTLFPELRGLSALVFELPDIDRLKQCDLIFFATPSGVAMQMVPDLLAAGCKVIDLSADFRLSDTQQWKQWYGQRHVATEANRVAVYGLPELNRQRIRDARLIANPGCYPTAVSLALMPLLAADLILSEDIIADAKSGVSGAGRKAVMGNLYAEINNSFKAYAASGHRHMPEMVEHLSTLISGSIELIFTPHLIPMTRGIQASVYARLRDSDDTLQVIQAAFENYYANEPFVDVLPPGSHPQTRSVAEKNICQIGLHRPPNSSRITVLSVIDNLVKGAAGQAVQNMNIMYNLDETTGLF